jgi:hypothetical protein
MNNELEVEATRRACADCLCDFDGNKCPDCGSRKYHLLSDVWGVVLSKNGPIDTEKDFQNIAVYGGQVI